MTAINFSVGGAMPYIWTAALFLCFYCSHLSRRKPLLWLTPACAAALAAAGADMGTADQCALFFLCAATLLSAALIRVFYLRSPRSALRKKRQGGRAVVVSRLTDYNEGTVFYKGSLRKAFADSNDGDIEAGRVVEVFAAGADTEDADIKKSSILICKKINGRQLFL